MFRMVVVQDFDDVAIEYTDQGTKKFCTPAMVAQMVRRAPQRRLLIAPSVSTFSKHPRTGSLHLLGVLMNH
jgi:hypothetical protein